MAFRPLQVWNRWAIQILLLLSLSMHVVLLPLAGIRRRRAPTILRVPLWLAYHLADTIGIYAIALLSLSSAPQEHRLMPFWAPFLLQHRGGPDSIGAYAFHDNQLWLRHLQLFVVKVLAVTYVLYIHLLPRASAKRDTFLAVAALLMWVVGVGKYGEKVAAIRGGNKSSIRSSLTKQPPAARHHHVNHWDHGGVLPKKATAAVAVDEEEEGYLRHAHHMFHFCKRATVDSSWLQEKDPEQSTLEMLRALRKQDARGMWAFAELQLSLLYDVLYTKAAVIHTWPGYLLRLASSLAIAAAFALLHFGGSDDGDDVVDVAVTYILLAGALVMEMASVLNALGSSWAYAFLCTTRWSWLRYAALCTGRWDRLRQLIKRTIRGRGSVSVRRWSGEMGQYNMLHFCSRRHNSRAHRPLAGRMAMALGFEDWWYRKHYSSTANISHELRQELFRYVQRLTETGLNSQGVIRKSWGQEALEREDKDLYERIKRERNLGVEFQEGVIIWHIGTDIFLARSRTGIEEAAAAGGGDGGDAAAELLLVMRSIRTLSNYMMFLLVNHPSMLPGLAQGMVYQRTCENLSDRCKNQQQQGHLITRGIGSKLREVFCLQDGPVSAPEQQLSHVYQLANMVYEETPKYSQSVPRLCYANGVAVELLGRVKEKGVEAVLRLLLDVWMDFVVYAANRCSRESHAKKLSSGGELTSVVWIMTDFLNQEAYARQKD